MRIYMLKLCSQAYTNIDLEIVLLGSLTITCGSKAGNRDTNPLYSFLRTRMYSSRMGNDRCGRCPKMGWGLSPGVVVLFCPGLSVPERGLCSGGGSLSQRPPPSLSVDKMTHACKNITFPQLCLRAVKIRVSCLK